MKIPLIDPLTISPIYIQCQVGGGDVSEECRSSVRTQIQSQSWAWMNAVRKNLAAIKSLNAGWDGRRSEPINIYVVARAEQTLRDALEGAQHVVAPYVVPMGNGGVQFEWHTQTLELEFVLGDGGASTAWLHDRETGAEIECEGSAALDLFYRWARLVASSDNDVYSVEVPENAPGFVFAT